MKYSKELHDTLVKSNYYDSHIINALLDEIDRLNAELERVKSEMLFVPILPDPESEEE